MDRSPAYLTRNAKLLRRDSTDAENRLWRHLRAKRLAGLKFKRQQAIGPYIVDFCCFHPALVIEIDGGQHASAEEADRERTEFLRSRGFVVLRFWNSEVLTETDAVVQRIAEKVRELLHSPLPNPLPEGEGTVDESSPTYAIEGRGRERAMAMLPSFSLEQHP